MHVLLFALVLMALLIASPALADGRLKARLTGYQEVPSLSTSARGLAEFKVKGDTIEYKLTYRGLDSGVLFAHIHFGQRHVNGGVSVFLCSNTPVPITTPECPDTGGTVSGVLSAADVIGPAEQAIEPGEFAELVRAINRGATYANVHSNAFGAGEIRGQIERERRH